MKKASKYRYLEAFRVPTGRCERIRTFDPLHPMQVRYQAAPHTESEPNYNPWQHRRYGLMSVNPGEQIADFKQLAAYQQQLLVADACAIIKLRVVKIIHL